MNIYIVNGRWLENQVTRKTLATKKVFFPWSQQTYQYLEVVLAKLMKQGSNLFDIPPLQKSFYSSENIILETNPFFSGMGQNTYLNGIKKLIMKYLLFLHGLFKPASYLFKWLYPYKLTLSSVNHARLAEKAQTNTTTPIPKDILKQLVKWNSRIHTHKRSSLGIDFGPITENHFISEYNGTKHYSKTKIKNFFCIENFSKIMRIPTWRQRILNQKYSSKFIHYQSSNKLKNKSTFQ